MLPEDILRLIFSKLDFQDKIASGLVCKQWDEVLKSGTVSAKHWDVPYDVDKLVSSFLKNEVTRGQINDGIERYGI